MIEHDFPSKHEMKQTYSLSKKTCIPLSTPNSSRDEATGHIICMNATAKNVEDVSVVRENTVSLQQRADSGRSVPPDHRESSSSQEGGFEKCSLSFHLRRDTSGQRLPVFRRVKCQASLCQVPAVFFFFMVARDP